jgi:hypothetical protein
MRLTVVDHLDGEWAARHARVHVRRPENGARTYSVDIVKHHVPMWRAELERIGAKTAAIGTCGPLELAQTTPAVGDVAIQYIHWSPIAKPLEDTIRTAEALSMRFDRVVFVTSCASTVDRLKGAGIEAVFVPMAIDAEAVRACASRHEPQPRTAVWFGNLTAGCARMHRMIGSALRARGWTMGTVSGGRINGIGPVLSQPALWEYASTHALGIGVSRSALELAALGLPVVVAGALFGGIVTDDAEWQTQTKNNFGSWVTTYSPDIGMCLDALDKIVTGRTNDLPLALDAIPGGL